MKGISKIQQFKGLKANKIAKLVPMLENINSI